MLLLLLLLLLLLQKDKVYLGTRRCVAAALEKEARTTIAMLGT